MNEDVENKPTKTSTTQNKGSRRLVLFGVASIFLAFITSGISLFIYTASGDIYLDRSRPGFISDDEPSTDDEQDRPTASFSPDGTITKEAITEYLQKLDSVTADVTADPNAFSSDALSDEALNITGSVDY